MKHALVKLAGEIDWAWMDEQVSPCFSEEGRPGVPTRFMVGLLLLKHRYSLSDEAVCERWIYDPYFQYFTGEEFFAHAFPHERSGMTHWRKRIGNKLEALLAESLRVAHATGALKLGDLARVTVDTTVQPKSVTHPTDAKLLHTAIKKLGELAKKEGLQLRQSYARLAKRAALMMGRYIHAKQFKRAKWELKFLRTRLGRLICDIRRKIDGDERLVRVLPNRWTRPTRSAGRTTISGARRFIPGTHRRPSASAPSASSGGKAHKPYEFGVKVSVTTTSRRCKGGQFVLHAKALPGNPYDGHSAP